MYLREVGLTADVNDKFVLFVCPLCLVGRATYVLGEGPIERLFELLHLRS